MALIIWSLLPWSFYEANLVLGVLILKDSYFLAFTTFPIRSYPAFLLRIVHGVAMVLPLDRFRPVLQFVQPFTVEKEAVLPIHEMPEK